MMENNINRINAVSACMRKIDHCVLNNKKKRIGYLQYLSNDSDFSGTDSGGEGEHIYAYWGPTLSASTLRRLWRTLFR